MIALASATAAVAAPDDTITVTGKRLTRDEVRAVARSYVRGVLALPSSGQYARWKDPICPHVIGLYDAHAALVTNRIREIAREAGARVAGPRCEVNLDVVFTTDGVSQMQTIARRSSRMMKDMPAPEREALLHGAQPVRWWYVTRVEGMNGHQVNGESAMLLTAQIEGGGPGFIQNGNGQYLDSYSSTIVGTGARAHFYSAVVLVDANRAKGRTLDAVADYVAMVSLAQLRMDGMTPGEDSVLNLFADGEPAAAGLTRSDAAFLKALYTVPPDRERQQQASAIMTVMARLLAQD